MDLSIPTLPPVSQTVQNPSTSNDLPQWEQQEISQLEGYSEMLQALAASPYTSPDELKQIISIMGQIQTLTSYFALKGSSADQQYATTQLTMIANEIKNL